MAVLESLEEIVFVGECPTCHLECMWRQVCHREGAQWESSCPTCDEDWRPALDDAGDEIPLVNLTVRVENAYELYPDVVEIKHIVVTRPASDQDRDDTDGWAYDQIYPHTGVGHEDGDSWYDVTVLATGEPEAIPLDTSWAWGY